LRVVRLLRRVEIPTPFGRVRLPEVVLPAPLEPLEFEIDERRRRALLHAVGSDIGGKIPIVGDVIEDLHGAEVKRLLTPEEYGEYLEEDKYAPSTIALLKVFLKRRGAKAM